MTDPHKDEDASTQLEHAPFPSRTGADVAHALAKAGISAIPSIGGPAAELFNLVLAPPIQRRRDAWLNELGERLTRLEQEGRVKSADLENNDAFVSTFLQASQVAVRNDQHEKIRALRNAALNTAIGPPLDDSKREMFLAFVDTFTVWHLRALTFLDDPNAWIYRHGLHVQQNLVCNTVEAALYNQFADLHRESEFRRALIQDLRSRSLIQADDSNFEFSGAESKRRSRATTRLGREFLCFISDPPGAPP